MTSGVAAWPPSAAEVCGFPPPSLARSSLEAAVVARLEQAGVVSARAEARWLLDEVVGATAWRKDPVSLAAAARLETLVQRRAAGEPLQYVVGYAPFGSLRLEVGPGVLVPRPETEILADEARRRLLEWRGGATVVDLCTGSGAIAAFLADAFASGHPKATIIATEHSAAAAAWARRNLAGSSVDVREGDLYEALSPDLVASVSMIVANPPYLPDALAPQLPADVRDHEPAMALYGGPDGLGIIRRILAGALTWLAPGGWLLCEIAEDQGDRARALAVAVGLQGARIAPDLTGRDRILEARAPW